MELLEWDAHAYDALPLPYESPRAFPNRSSTTSDYGSMRRAPDPASISEQHPASISEQHTAANTQRRTGKAGSLRVCSLAERSPVIRGGGQKWLRLRIRISSH